MYLNVFTTYLLYVSAAITIKMANVLTDKIFLQFGSDLDLEISISNDKFTVS